ncbi:MAG: DNA-directed RNA polymerase subunit H [Thermofilum sp. ex4484_15]|nr:MAG: DNA-directed RNA polymerase subunit H [Thermofilum sp. ex4484_15]
MGKFNIFKHELVPKHILLSKDEARKLLRKLGLTPYQLPWILASDPAARALGAKPGDVVLIVRKSPTAGRSLALRLVIPG